MSHLDSAFQTEGMDLTFQRGPSCPIPVHWNGRQTLSWNVTFLQLESINSLHYNNNAKIKMDTQCSIPFETSIIHMGSDSPGYKNS